MQEDKKLNIDLRELNKGPKDSFLKVVISKVRSRFGKSEYPNRDQAGKFTSGAGGMLASRKFNLRRVVPVIAVVGLVGGYLVFRGFAMTQAPSYNLKAYYPNTDLFTSQYLEGNNYIGSTPQRSVLWFE